LYANKLNSFIFLRKYKNIKKEICFEGRFDMAIDWVGIIVRFVVSALVLMLIGYLLPGITVAGFTGALIAAIVIAVIGFAVEYVLGDKISPRSRGWVGFITAAVVIYLAQFIIPSYLSVSLLGSLLAAFVIGLVDAFVPTALR